MCLVRARTHGIAVLAHDLLPLADDAWQDEPEETSISGLAGGCCFDFNTNNEHLFIVGTEEGKIHKCSKAYSGQYLET